jgi:enamine deaminase RidA (YjgF/YER057c/UK114 family)
MAGEIDARLQEMGIEVPEPAAPVANYVAYVVSGNLIFVSGQVPIQGGEFQYVGKVGGELTVEDGQAAARLCGINIIAQLKRALGGFTQQPQVINGVSDLIGEVFGDKGKHARAAVSAGSLPAGVAVEVDAVVEFA